MSRLSLPSHSLATETGTRSKAILAVCLPILGIALSELLLSIGSVGPAIWLYTGTFLFCTLLPLRLSGTISVLTGFVFLIVFRLVNLSMPVFLDLSLYWTLLVYLPFPVASLWFLHSSEAVDVRLDARGTLLWSPIALGAGIVLAVVESRALGASTLLPTVTSVGVWFLVAVAVLGTLAEELILRGILQSALRHPFGPWPAVAAVSVVFAAMQVPFGRTAVALGLVAGTVYGAGYELSDSLVVPLVCRATVNVFVLALVPAASAGLVALPVPS